MNQWFSQLRTRLVLLVLLSVLPALVLILLTGYEQRRLAEQKATEDALRVVTLAAENQQLLVENTRGFLIALAHVAGLNNNELTDCEHIFAHLQDEHYPYYTGFYLADLEGNIICSTPGESPDHLLSCPHYNNLIHATGFTVSTYHICRQSGEGVISLGYPVIDDSGAISGVVNAGIDLNWFNRLAENSNLPPGSILMVTDEDGTILSHYPEPETWVGEALPDKNLFALIMARIQGTASIEDINGAQMLYAFTPLWSENQKVFVSLGTPASVAFAQANRVILRNLALLALATLLVAAFAWYLGDFLLVRQTKKLVLTTQRLASGEFQTRTDLSASTGEIGMLAKAVDQMAEALEQRDSERRAADAALREYAVNLEQRNRELQEFNYITSHDLQEPLRKIQVFSDLLKRRYAEVLDDRAQSYIKSMSDSANRMQTLLGDLLSYSQVTSRAKPFVSTDLNEILRQVVSDLAYRIESSNGRIDYENLPVIEADPTQMYQLFQNLLSNALKFQKPGQPATISITCNGNDVARGQTGQSIETSGMLNIFIKDNGIGFDEKYAGRIFKPFERLHGVGEYEGTGMGLAICRKIVERHNGSITGKATPGQGATFIVNLPLRQLKEEAIG